MKHHVLGLKGEGIPVGRKISLSTLNFIFLWVIQIEMKKLDIWVSNSDAWPKQTV